ncbi:hypothetical protein P344_06410 [Spiroplasma mirum ATCC 29335]|uniref:Uncharacterized protein n=1 Tax=Spiroplasma mirum ATCC 29335 TaxID=838561 RepID=W6APD8_9MOLU|nr:hypothetical protein P344_06410 [Spiroplasma mirum ATCC 29335]
MEAKIIPEIVVIIVPKIRPNKLLLFCFSSRGNLVPVRCLTSKSKAVLWVSIQHEGITFYLKIITKLLIQKILIFQK